MSNAIQYDGTINCALSVTDLDKAIDWYQNVLGFELSMKFEDMGWAEFKAPATGVTVGLSQVESVPTGGGATVVFGVVDLDRVRQRLEAHDVRFDGETQVIPEMTKLATFFDPDGNTLMISESLLPH